MQIRIVRLRPRNTLAALALLVVVLALLAVVLTAGMALLAGAAVVGAVGVLARRLLGGGRRVAGRGDAERIVLTGEEVFPPGEQGPDDRRLPPAGGA